MKENVKNNILEAGARLIHLKGFNNTGLQEILNEADVPRGSFYFYFKNKEDFGLRIIDYFNDLYLEMAQPILEDESRPPLKRIENLFDQFIQVFESFDYTRGCPIGNLAQEMGDLSPAFRAKLRDSFNLMVGVNEKILKQAQNNGDIPSRFNCRATADFIVSSWHGALVRMKIEKSSAPLENHKHFIINELLAAPLD